MRRTFTILLSVLLVVGGLCARAEQPTRGGVVMTPESEAVSGRPLAGVKIGIDPGHQANANNEREAVAPGSGETKAKVSSGTRGTATGVAEYVVNLDVSLQLAEALGEMGAQVKLTRETGDVDISNQQRAIMMNEWGADLVLRIHCNGSVNSAAHGIGTYVRDTGVCAQESYALGEALLNAMVNATGAAKQSVYKRDTYTGLNWSEVPSVLVEMGYMSNAEEDQKLNDPEYQKLLVEGMIQGIIDYFR